VALSADGPLTNGENHAGTISVAGEVDVWTFGATAGDAIVVAIGETGGDSAFVPWIRLHRPDNTIIGNQSGTLAAQIEVVAPATGTYTVEVASFDSGFNDTGSYTLTLAKAPGAFAISAGDEGGPLTNGGNHTGTIHIGDVDMWSFSATAGEAIMLAIGEVGADSPFIPWIRLKSPTGQNLGSQSGALAGELHFPASCFSMPAKSTRSQCSANFPLSTRQMSMVAKLILLPVGAKPRTVCACVPAYRHRATTLSASMIRSSTCMWMSGRVETLRVGDLRGKSGRAAARVLDIALGEDVRESRDIERVDGCDVAIKNRGVCRRRR